MKGRPKNSKGKLYQVTDWLEDADFFDAIAGFYKIKPVRKNNWKWLELIQQEIPNSVIEQRKKNGRLMRALKRPREDFKLLEEE